MWDAEIHWFGPHGGLRNWADTKSKQFACLIHEDDRSALYLMFNAGAYAVDFSLPAAPAEARWRLAVDTAREAPQDVLVTGAEMDVDGSQPCKLHARSSAILVARKQAA